MTQPRLLTDRTFVLRDMLLNKLAPRVKAILESRLAPSVQMSRRPFKSLRKHPASVLESNLFLNRCLNRKVILVGAALRLLPQQTLLHLRQGPKSAEMNFRLRTKALTPL